MCITRVRTCVQLRVYSAPSNKLLTTAFEASIEFVAVTLQAKRRQQITGNIYQSERTISHSSDLRNYIKEILVIDTYTKKQ